MKHSMKDQWDRISAENAFFGVLSRGGYENAEAVDIKQFWKTGREDVDTFMKITDFDDSKSLRMLEIGCGLGRMTHHFGSLFGKVYAVDVSEDMLNKARGYWGHLDNVEWILGNGESLEPITRESVDFVFSIWVLQHIPDSNTVLNYVRESARILKRDGTALLQFRVMPPHSSLVALKYFIFTHWPSPVTKLLMRLWDAVNGRSGLRARFAREYEAWRGCALRTSAIEAVAAEAGLQVLGTESMGRQSPGTESRYYLFRKA